MYVLAKRSARQMFGQETVVVVICSPCSTHSCLPCPALRLLSLQATHVQKRGLYSPNDGFVKEPRRARFRDSPA